jgi:DNA-binding NarL/FixJ family response regulator
MTSDAADLTRIPGQRSDGDPDVAVKYLLVLDDYATFADAMATRLNAEPGLRAFAATTIEQAQLIMREHRFDGLLLDLNLGCGHDGLRFAAVALAAQPDLRIVVVTGSNDGRQVVDAVRAGVLGWVRKDEPIQHLLEVVRGALLGETWIPPRLLTGVIDEMKAAQRHNTESDILIGKLTRREREILGLLAAGLSIDEICSRLVLSRNTVRTHVQNIIGKLGVHSAVAAVAVARRACLRVPPIGDDA